MYAMVIASNHKSHEHDYSLYAYSGLVHSNHLQYVTTCCCSSDMFWHCFKHMRCTCSLTDVFCYVDPLSLIRWPCQTPCYKSIRKLGSELIKIFLNVQSFLKGDAGWFIPLKWLLIRDMMKDKRTETEGFDHWPVRSFVAEVHEGYVFPLNPVWPVRDKGWWVARLAQYRILH